MGAKDLLSSSSHLDTHRNRLDAVWRQRLFDGLSVYCRLAGLATKHGQGRTAGAVQHQACYSAVLMPVTPGTDHISTRKLATCRVDTDAQPGTQQRHKYGPGRTVGAVPRPVC